MWAEKTYKELLLTAKMKGKTKNRLMKVMKKLGVLDMTITGQSITGLEKTAEVRLRAGISYSQAFQLALEEDAEKLPALYLKHLAANLEHVERSRLRGIIARGLRTLPSLLRDQDFGERLEALIPKILPDVDFEVAINPKIDTKEHTDVCLKLQGNNYRIWLYQFTSRGLPHDIERVLGRRGILPDGIHILCPIKTDVVREKEKLEKRLNRLEKRIDENRRKYESYRNKNCKGAKERLAKVKNAKEELKEIVEKLKEITPIAEADVVPVNGWYFYSDKKIMSFLEKLKATAYGNSKPDSYSEVCQILSEPERYLSQIRFFMK